MNANKLMIGDWVLYHASGWNSDNTKWESDDKVKIASLPYLYVDYNNGNGQMPANSSEIEGLLLTEDILKLNGFDFDCDNDAWRIYSLYDESPIIFDIGKRGKYIISCCNGDHHIHYVHELQQAIRFSGLEELSNHFKIE